MSWSTRSDQVRSVRRKSLAALATIRRVSTHMSTVLLISLYNAFVLPHFSVLWHFCTLTMYTQRVQCLQRVQNYAMCIVLKKPPRTSSKFYYGLLSWLTLFQYLCTTLLWQAHRCFLILLQHTCTQNFKLIKNLAIKYSYTRAL